MRRFLLIVAVLGLVGVPFAVRGEGEGNVTLDWVVRTGFESQSESGNVDLQQTQLDLQDGFQLYDVTLLFLAPDGIIDEVSVLIQGRIDELVLPLQWGEALDGQGTGRACGAEHRNQNASGPAT